MTRFMTIDRPNRGLEMAAVGSAKTIAALRQTPKPNSSCSNTPSKPLAPFGAEKSAPIVATSSQRAIERLGLVREGLLRKNAIMPDGYQRSSYFYSVIDDEWPHLKMRLLTLLSD